MSDYFPTFQKTKEWLWLHLFQPQYSKRDLILLTWGALFLGAGVVCLFYVLDENGYVGLFTAGGNYLYGKPFSFGAATIVYWIGFLSLLSLFLKKKFSILFLNLVGSLIFVLLSFKIGYNFGDFAGRGFPYAFWTGVWSLGFEYSFFLFGFVLDLIFWLGFLQLLSVIVTSWNFAEPSSRFKFPLRLFVVVPVLLVISGSIAIDIAAGAVSDYKIEETRKLINRAAIEQNLLLCERLAKPRTPSPSEISAYDQCVYKVAVSSQNETYCDKTRMRNQCFGDVGIAKQDATLCARTRECETCRERCFREIAVATHDPELCVQDPHPHVCFSEYITKTNDYTACDKISLGTQKEDCVFVLKQIKH